MNGFMHIFEDHRNFLPLSARALKAWERQQTIQEGEPIPFQAMGLIIQQLCSMGAIYEACAAVVQLDGWLREQDWSILRRGDICFDSCGNVAITLGNRARGEKVKTGSGQGVHIEFVLTKAILKEMVKGLSADEQVFPLTTDKFRRQWNRALEMLDLAHMGPPHGIRHAGAAHYVANNGDLEYARRRGRWNTASALQRYTKTHVLIRRRSELQRQQLLDGESFWAHPGKAMAAAIRTSPAASSQFALRLVNTLGQLKGDAVDLGVVSSHAMRPEVGRPSSGVKVSIRRKGSR